MSVLKPSCAYAAPAGEVGVVDYQLVLSKYPDMQKANEAYQAEVDQAKKDFEAKSAGLIDKDKQELAVQFEQRVEQKRRELLGPILDKINAAVKTVSNARGLSILVFALAGLVKYSGSGRYDSSSSMLQT